MVVWTRVTFALALKMLSFIKEKGEKTKISKLFGVKVRFKGGYILQRNRLFVDDRMDESF